jgi:GT2 family glycosyltransferase
MIIPDSAEKSGDLFTKIRANPPWNLDLILGGEGVGPLLAIHNSVISEIIKTGEDLSKSKNLTEIALTAYNHLGEKAISRLPLVLSATTKQSEQTQLDTTITEYLREVDDEIFLSQGLCPQTRRIHWPIASQEPKVSILIPSKDRSDLLERCLNGIYESSDYSNFEVIVIDHQSNEEDALELLEKIDKRDDTRVLEFEGEFNFSLMNNIAAESSTGDFLCLLNNDIEVISSDWIQELVSHASREHVGVVGALLRYPDKSIQHAGLSPNLGSLYGHAHKYFPSGNFGYRNRLAVAHQVAAVTGACLMTSRELWGELGGLNQQLAVAYNDVDYCLRARTSGYQIIWTPFAELIHHESLSRGYDEHPKQRDRLAKESDLFVSLWKDFLDDDPAYSPNLTLESTNFSLSDQPRFLPPWRKKL